MTKILRTLLALAALLAIVAFAVANRTPVPVSLAPLPIVIELPVYGVFLIGLVLGGLIGGLALWLSGLPQRFQARRMRRKVSALERQVGVLQEREQRARAESYSGQRGIITAGTSS